MSVGLTVAKLQKITAASF